MKEINKLVLGTAGLGGIWREIDVQESILTILDALKYRIAAIDTAPAYGDAEELVGKALNQWTGKRPLISTKVGRLKGYRVDEAHYDYTVDGMKRSVENSLKSLNIPIIDILFLHDPAAIPPSDIEQVLKQMEFFMHQGYAKRIGLGGNAPEWFEPYFKSNQFDVIMEYNRLNACCIDALNSAIPFCRENSRKYYAASPLNMGLLGSSFSEFTTSPPNWLGVKNIEQAKRVNSIADKYNLSLQELAHRFLLTIPAEFKIVIGAADRMQLRDTLDAMKLGELPTEIYDEILLTLNRQ
ncbi:aldo/keto reductase [Pedobacter panaciterrae]|jgi:Predicted oxidoreductases (related to aryl-alcohol dehydrogenases)|uniref:aldo/keto reductase n=1 Tax=Pedobacter panaciterrae TaxID=363849 RepID=UPI00155DBFA6|nr:aldo/keto reductase [Pedobacter panaciterrae]NQX53086.1 aldo/keto reductase [Pedobacter panaciterrae]